MGKLLTNGKKAFACDENQWLIPVFDVTRVLFSALSCDEKVEAKPAESVHRERKPNVMQRLLRNVLLNDLK